MINRLPNVKVFNGNTATRRVNNCSGRETFVDDNQVEFAEDFRFVIDALDSGDDDWSSGVARMQPGRVDADIDAVAQRANLSGVLLQELLDVRQDENATAPQLDGVGRNLRDHDGLAGRGRRDNARIIVMLGKILIDGGHRLALIRSK